MSVLITLGAVTLRALLGRRRFVVLALFAALPALVAILVRVGGGSTDLVDIADALVVRAVLPLTALVLGIAALGGELDDGTAVYLLAKPIGRWQIVVAKTVVAGGLSAVLVTVSTVAAALLIADDAALRVGLAFAAASSLAAFAYAALFVTASVLTRRAMLLGLIYTILWEGILAGVLEGTRSFSVREATLALAASFAGLPPIEPSSVDPGLGFVLLVVIGAGGVAIGSWRLRSYEIRGAE